MSRGETNLTFLASISHVYFWIVTFSSATFVKIPCIASSSSRVLMVTQQQMRSSLFCVCCFGWSACWWEFRACRINYEIHPLINFIRFIICDDTLVLIFDSSIFYSLDPWYFRCCVIFFFPAKKPMTVASLSSIIAPSQHSKGVHLSLLPIDSPCQESLVQVARGPSMCWQPTWLGTPFVIRL
jgi:hypothetical protein